MSGHQYAKNVTALFMSFAGAGTVGLGGAALFGKKFAEKIPNPVVKGIVFVVSIAGGYFVGEGTRKVFEIFKEEDDIISRRMFDAVIVDVCLDYMFDDKEVECFLTELFKDKESKQTLKTAMKRLYSSKEQYTMLRAVMDRAANKVARERPLLTKEQEPDSDSLSDALAEIIGESELEEVPI